MPAFSATGTICTAPKPPSLAIVRAAAIMAARRAARRRLTFSVRRYGIGEPESATERQHVNHDSTPATIVGIRALRRICPALWHRARLWHTESDETPYGRHAHDRQNASARGPGHDFGPRRRRAGRRAKQLSVAADQLHRAAG